MSNVFAWAVVVGALAWIGRETVRQREHDARKAESAAVVMAAIAEIVCCANARAGPAGREGG
jgi:hypothetical protein